MSRLADSLYRFGPDRPPVEITNHGYTRPTVPDDSVPTMTIATAIPVDSSAMPQSQILAVIRSNGNYPLMGIRVGNNYIVRNRVNPAAPATWITMLVPADPTAPGRVLSRESSEYTHGDPAEPRLVRISVNSAALGVCLSDPLCPSGHCGYY